MLFRSRTLFEATLLYVYVCAGITKFNLVLPTTLSEISVYCFFHSDIYMYVIYNILDLSIHLSSVYTQVNISVLLNKCVTQSRRQNNDIHVLGLKSTWLVILLPDMRSVLHTEAIISRNAKDCCA